MFINQLDEGLPAFCKFTGPKDDPKNDTYFVAALSEIQSFLFDAST